MNRRLRFPLYAQILFWFLVNVIAVACVLAFFVWRQLDVDSLVSVQSRERLESMAEVVSKELRNSAQSGWEEILARHEEAWRVTLGVFTPGARHLGGKVKELPEKTREAFAKRFPGASSDESRPGRRQAKGERPGRPPGVREEGDDLDAIIDEFLNDERRPGKGISGGRPPVRAPDQANSFFVLRSGDPETYWAGVHISLAGRVHKHFPEGVLVVVSDPSGSGLFFDSKPFVWWGVGMLGLSALIWLPFVGRLTGRIKSLTRATEEISDGQFAVRPATKHSDEVGRLSRGVERMAERLDQHITGQRRFLGDIAHELRSPIARMRMTMGILEQRLTDLPNRERVADVEEEIGELAKLVDELLAFSKASVKPQDVKLEDIPLVEILEPVIGRESGGPPVQMEIEGELLVHGNDTMLQRAFANVLRNALKYSGDDGEVIVEAETEGDHVVLRVGDDGPGVPEEELAFLMEPFYRPELARTREGGGFGLGLAIAKTCVESCEGTLSCRNREGGGFIVSIRMRAGLA